MKELMKNIKPIILVTGATGAEGGSVARALIKQSKFHVQILTRNPHSQKALVLQRAGAEIVAGDMNNIESLKLAIKDCYGVFGVINSNGNYNKEYELAKNLIDAVYQTGIHHFVLQTFPDYNRLSNGKYPVPEFDTKARLEEYTMYLKIPTTFIHPAFYYENFLTFFPLQKDNNDGYYFGFPQGNTKLAMASVEDLGKVVASIFDQPEKYIDKVAGLVGADNTCHEYAAILSKVLNKNVYYNHIPRNIYAAYNFPRAEEMANMFEVQRLHITSRQQDLEESYELNPSMQSFEKWVEKHKAKFISYFNSLFEVIVI